MSGRMGWLLLVVIGFGGCSRFVTHPELPVASSVELDELVVYSDFKLPDNHRLLRDLEMLRAEITDQLSIPVSDEQVYVYIFKTPRRYKKFLRQHFPEFPDRRAFFVETESRLSVYSYWGDRIAEDLRHEVSHGYLHAVVPAVPLWLDEGLAEYFEGGPGDAGFNQPHLQQILAATNQGNWQPDLIRLERLEDVAEMRQIDYAEAWLWTHFLLRTTAVRKKLLSDYLKQCQGRPKRPLSKIWFELEPDAEQHLVEHLRMLKKDESLFQDQPETVVSESHRLK
jgi:hypothetical protein